MRSTSASVAAVVGAAGVGLGVLGLFAGSATARAELSQQARLSFTHQPERFTALYVTDPAGRPTRAVPGRPVWVDFSIQNHEGRGVRYRYVATLTAAGRAAVTRAGTVEVADGHRVRRRVGLGLGSPSGYSVTVQLEGTGDTIRYRVGAASPVGAGSGVGTGGGGRNGGKR